MPRYLFTGNTEEVFPTIITADGVLVAQPGQTVDLDNASVEHARLVRVADAAEVHTEASLIVPEPPALVITIEPSSPFLVGGPVDLAQLASIGESGPETVSLPAGGAVVPHDELPPPADPSTDHTETQES